MTRDCAVFDFCGTLSNRNRIDDPPTRLALCAGFLGGAHHPHLATMSDQLLLENSAGLDEQATVDGFMGHAHALEQRCCAEWLNPPWRISRRSRGEVRLDRTTSRPLRDQSDVPPAGGLRTGYLQWRRRPPSTRAQANVRLDAQVA